MKKLNIIITFFFLLAFHAIHSQTQLWVGETYSCYITDYANANTSKSIVNKEWKKSADLNYYISGDYVRTVFFDKYVSGVHEVTASWSETNLSDSSPFVHKSHTWYFTCRDNPLMLDNTSITISENETATIGYRFSYSNQYTSGAKVTFTSSNTNVATVNSTGVVTPKSEGTTTITVKSSISKDSKTCTVTVNPVAPTIINVTSISLNSSSVTLKEGYSKQLTATVSPTNATDKTVTWSSSNTSIATVSSSGYITAKSAGTATITCRANDGSGIYATCYVTVTAAQVSVTSISLSSTSETLYVNETKWLYATVYPSNATNKNVTWLSNNPGVASVNSSGKVTANSAGTATITCYSDANSSVYATCIVTVKDVLVTSVSLSSTSETLYVNETKWLYATVYPSNATNKNVTWLSNNSSVASVNSSGKITANSAGTARITCYSDANSSVYATCIVTVKNVSPTGITISPSSRQTMVVGDERKFGYTLSPSYAVSPVTWGLSGDTDAATLSSSGWLTAKAEGTVRVTVTTANGYSSSCYVDISPLPTAITLASTEVELLMGREQQLSYSFSPANAKVHTVAWTSSDNVVASVSSSGVVKAHTPGTATITATTDNGKTASCTVTVPAPLYQLFVWTKDGEKTGYLSTDKPQLRLVNGVVKFTTDKLSFDIPKEALDKFTLEQVLPEHPLDIAMVSNIRIGRGRTYRLTYTLTPADAQTQVAWLNSNPEVVSVSSDGLLTALRLGTATLKAQTGNGLHATCLVTVPAPLYRFYVHLRDGSVESYSVDEKPLVTIGDEGIFTLTTSTKTVGYVAKDLVKFTLEDTSLNAVEGDVNRDGQFTLADIIAILSVYQGTQDVADYDADLDGDGNITVADITKLINLFLNNK